MPEMPEVEAFKKYIADTSLNKEIVDVQTNIKSLIKKAIFEDFRKTLLKKRFVSVERRGKYLLLGLSDCDERIVMHFGLTGLVMYTNNDQEPQYYYVKFLFKSGALNWITIRKFGSIWLVIDPNEIQAIKTLGPDPMQLSQNQFLNIMNEHTRKNIKAFLMDQEIISGIGNEYSDEILYQAGINPHQDINDLTYEKKKKIYDKMKLVLNYAIKLRKEYIQDIGEEEGFSGSLFKSTYLQAHRHSDKRCPKNKKHTLKKEKIAGRTAYYCPEHQK